MLRRTLRASQPVITGLGPVSKTQLCHPHQLDLWSGPSLAGISI